jgi:hypothetical protein
LNCCVKSLSIEKYEIKKEALKASFLFMLNYLQLKLEARLTSPDPLYVATLGYGHKGLVRSAAHEAGTSALIKAVTVLVPKPRAFATTLVGVTPFSTQLTNGSIRSN